MSDTNNDTPHAPGPSLWPIAFAIGVACLLVGLIISWIVAAIGVVIAVVFGILWAREVTRDVRDEVPAIEPETRTVADQATAEAAPAAAAPAPLPAYTRSRFLEASTLGLGAAIGVVVTLPVLGFTVLPSFTNLGETDADLGPIENFPEGTFVIATYLAQADLGEVSRRTSFVRYNGMVENPASKGRLEPSFTILYSRCVHLGCPVQPNGPIDEEATKKVKGVELRPCSRSPSDARVTAGCTTPRATVAPALPCARSTARSTRFATGISCSVPTTPWATCRAPVRTQRSRAIHGRFRAHMSTASRRGCIRSSRAR